jgi:hypothetical protein
MIRERTLLVPFFTLSINSSEPFRSSSRKSLLAALDRTSLRLYRRIAACCSSDLFRSRLRSGIVPSSLISIPAHCSGVPTVAVSYSIMSDTHFDPDSISDASNVHSDETLISSAVSELCNQLRAKDRRVFGQLSGVGCSEAKCNWQELLNERRLLLTLEEQHRKALINAGESKPTRLFLYRRH